MLSAILLAGGTGSRMKSQTPKQFLELQGKPLILHSLEIFLKTPEIHEIIVVAPAEYHSFFAAYPVKLALPGKRRQDSVYNGLLQVAPTSQWIMTHDGVRPFITVKMIQTLIGEGMKVGAASLGVPVKPTMKECNGDGFVERTPLREKVWEVQTPQFLSKELFKNGFKMAHERGLTLTECASFAEIQNHPVKMVLGSYTNLKITTPEDLLIAEAFVNSLN